MKAEAYALFCLAGRSYHSQILKDKMLKKGYAKLEVDEIIGKLKNMGYLNDEEWLLRFVENKTAQGYGLRMIAYLLLQKKIAMPPTFEEEASSILDFVLRKGLDKKMLKDKLIAYLLRRGFSYEAIKETLLELKTRHDRDSAETQ